MNIQDAFDKLMGIHDGVYLFPQFQNEYTSSTSVVTGVCPFHGPFRIKYRDAVRLKRGCPHCSDLRRVLSTKYGRKVSREEMIRFYKFVSDQNYRETMLSSFGWDIVFKSDYPLLINNSYDLLRKVYFKYKFLSGTFSCSF